MQSEATFKPKLDFLGQTKKYGRKTLNYVKVNGKQNLIIFGVLLILFLVFTIINSSFASASNLVSIAQKVLPYAVMGLGVTFVIALGLIDLSIGTVMIACATIGGSMVNNGAGVDPGVAIPVMIIVGGLFGFFNGFLVAKLKMPAFIATLGTMMLSRGLVALIVNQSNVFFTQRTWYNSVFSSANGFPIGFIWLIVLAAVCMYLMYKCKVGRYILAIGSNEEAARLSGVQTVKFKWIAFTISGLAAGIAAIFYSAAFPTVSVGTGNGMELDAIAGVYIGGTSASGGIASIVGSVIGALILVVLQSGLSTMIGTLGISINSNYLTFVVTGIIVVIAVLIDTMKNTNANKVKMELLASEYKKKMKERLLALYEQIDYTRCDKSLQPSERESKTVQLREEISSLKVEIQKEYARLHEEDLKKIAEIKATKAAARQAAREEKQKIKDK